MIFGISQGSLLPKAGAWMNQVKRLFGIMMLGLAIWMLSRILPSMIIILLTSALIIISTTVFGALDFQRTTARSRLQHGVSFFGLLCGVILLIGLASGNYDLTQPLHFAANTTVASKVLPTASLFTLAKTPAEMNKLLMEAKTAGRPVLIDFWASWCPDCKIVDKTIFSNSKVQQMLQDFKVIRVNITTDNPELAQLRKRFKVFGTPTILFYSKKSKELIAQRSNGNSSLQEFQDTLTQITKQ